MGAVYDLIRFALSPLAWCVLGTGVYVAWWLWQNWYWAGVWFRPDGQDRYDILQGNHRKIGFMRERQDGWYVTLRSEHGQCSDECRPTLAVAQDYAKRLAAGRLREHETEP